MTLFDPEPIPPPRPAIAPPVAPAATPSLPIEVIRSKKRKRTVGAQVRNGVLRVTVPAWMTRAETATWVTKMAARFERLDSAERIDLPARTAALARRHDLPEPTGIKWADNMQHRWGSCTPETGVIRLSTRLARFPDWVVDSVIVHELVHLEVPGHGPEFWARANRYPKMERAIGYLIAKSDEPDPAAVDGDPVDGAGFDEW